MALPFRLGCFYFAHFAYSSAFVAYLPLYLTWRGLQPGEIAWVLALPPLARSFAPAAWGWLADRSGAQRGIVAFSCAAMAAGFGMLPYTQGVVSISWVIGVASLLSAGALPLVEAVTLGALAGQAGRYGPIRLWGAGDEVAIQSCGEGAPRRRILHGGRARGAVHLSDPAPGARRLRRHDDRAALDDRRARRDRGVSLSAGAVPALFAFRHPGVQLRLRRAALRRHRLGRRFSLGPRPRAAAARRDFRLIPRRVGCRGALRFSGRGARPRAGAFFQHLLRRRRRCRCVDGGLGLGSGRAWSGVLAVRTGCGGRRLSRSAIETSRPLKML